MTVTKNIRIVVLTTAVFGGVTFATAQASQSDEPPKPKANKQTDSATKNADDQPKWDPLRAEKDLEVGQYYMRIGKIDAAIDRFQDAIEAKPGYAVPFLWLGEAQEKKGMKRDALKSYRRYLELYPHAEDRERIEKKIEKLGRDVGDKKKV
ncbi:MAG: hypothetical protein NVS9B14_12770 [Candidatus Acidiferrum sp.]